jgi:hypothetical protein
MNELQRLLVLQEVYDTAIEELFVLGDRSFVDFILRLERRLQQTNARVAELERAPVVDAGSAATTAVAVDAFPA